MFLTDLGRGIISPRVSGTLTPAAALNLLLGGASLRFEYLDAQTVAVLPSREQTPETLLRPLSQEDSNIIRMASAAPVTEGPSHSPASGLDDSETQSIPQRDRRKELEEILVTGSRIQRATGEGAQDVKVYTRQQIEQSGQTNIADFLNTLSVVSIGNSEAGAHTFAGATTVQLRGLPLGTTLVLLNGRRVETSGSELRFNIFDLNTIPASAVERIEVLAEGSSAVYGSDAIAGVVNIVLRDKFDGVELNATRSEASDFNTTEANAAVGKQWSQGGFSIIGTYQRQSELLNSDRSLTRSQDYRAFGGPNSNTQVCNPGNVYSADGVTPLPGLGATTYAAVPVGYSGTPSIQEFQATAGKLNECSFTAGASLIPSAERFGIYARGEFHFESNVQAFTELLFSRTKESQYYGTQNTLFGVPSFQSFTVGPQNPYNPFGTRVGISEALTALPRTGAIGDTQFVRPLLGLKGTLPRGWSWEASTWLSQDHTTASSPGANVNMSAIQNALDAANPAIALNPFVPGSPAPEKELLGFFTPLASQTFDSRAISVDGFLRGPVAQLPGGGIETVFGVDFENDRFSEHDLNSAVLGVPSDDFRLGPFSRSRSSAFAEARIPILGASQGADSQQRLVATLAARYDHYSDFGSKNTPQLGLEWHPFRYLGIRGTYAKAFKAPTLFQRYSPAEVAPVQVIDPTNGQAVVVNSTSGGNRELRPESGASRTLGLIYDYPGKQHLFLSATFWSINERDAIQPLLPDVIVANEALFSSRIIRAASCAGGPPCPIVAVDDSYVNFGGIKVKGIDYQVSNALKAVTGEWRAALQATQILRYSTSLAPGSPSIDSNSNAQGTGLWSPRWKATISLNWSRGPYVINFGGRYVGRYRDFAPLPNGDFLTLGNFWYMDANVRYSLGNYFASGSNWLHGAYLEFGAVNLLNKQPQFSMAGGGFIGYDPSQADARGRLLHFRVGARW